MKNAITSEHLWLMLGQMVELPANCVQFTIRGRLNTPATIECEVRVSDRANGFRTENRKYKLIAADEGDL